MPFACLKSVREVSSEDSVHVAANLLQQNPGKKWKTLSCGDKSAYVILEMDELQQITGIDIGNEHSAFVEVQVGKEGCATDSFSDILITCSFMTPVESKNSTNTNRVRCFAQDALVETALSSKWKLIKVICSQPFNKHVQFGLSFIKIHIANDISRKKSLTNSLVAEKLQTRIELDDANDNGLSRAVTLAKFTLREDSPDSDTESAVGLFNRWKKMRKSLGEPPTTAAAIREASSPNSLSKNFKQTLSSTPITSTHIEPRNHQKQILDRNRDLLLFGSDYDVLPKKNLEKKIEADRERLRIENEKLIQEKKKAKEALSGRNDSKPDNAVCKAAEKPKKRCSSPSSSIPAKKIKEKNTKYLPFNQLLKGVCLVISGIQNPDRSELRRKALEMGAQYKADWENGCTHLICAFKNTPKYNQVKGKGKIITRSWIEKCYSMKKYLPWRRFGLESSELAKPESDEEILEEAKKSVNKTDDESDSRPSTLQAQKNDIDQTLDIYDLAGSNQTYNITSGSDTEDEILKATKANQKIDSTVSSNKETGMKDPITYEISTEEEDFLEEKIEKINKKLFFKGLNFLICKDVSVVEKIKVEKIIERFGGTISTGFSNVQYAITNEPLDDSHKIKFIGEAVKPLWIFECSDMEVKVSTQRYIA